MMNHPKFNMSWILALRKWDLCLIEYTDSITLKDVENNPKYPWHWTCMSVRIGRDYVTAEFIDKFENMEWNWNLVKLAIQLNLTDVVEYPSNNWRWKVASYSSTLTIIDINKYPKSNWNWSYLSQHPNIAMQDINNHPEYPWEWAFVSDNPNLTMSMISKNIRKP